MSDRSDASSHPRRVGLARTLSKMGYASRSRASEMVRSGLVSLNGTICRNPQTPIQVGKDRIKVEGIPIREAEKIYLMLNKPRGIVTTASDEKGRETIYGLLPPGLPWIAPVGRLDKASEGLLLLTNDSEWAARVLEPATHLERVYHVQVGVVADSHIIKVLQDGIPDDAGERLRAKYAKILRGGKKNTWLEIILEEGKNRQIRRMLAVLGVEVLRLVRVSIGPVALGNLTKGKYRTLTVAEKQSLELELGRKLFKKKE
jgi:23S rRNA pseudouridine2605 synthase